jgi:hypothetical protein
VSIPADMLKKSSKSKHRISLNMDQYDWLSKQMQRRAHLGKVTGVDKKNPKLYRIIEELVDLLTLAEIGYDGAMATGAILETGRQQLRVLGDIVQKQIDGLEQKVLPAYADKKAMEGRDTYEPRMLQASGLLRQLKALSEQIENVYNEGSKRRPSDYGRRGRT